MKRIETRIEMLSMPYDTNVWYHVTDASNLQSIRDHGLAPYNRGITEKAVPDFSIVENGIYLSPTVSGAQAFANAYKSRHRGQYAILQIRDIDKNRLIVDPEDVDAEWEQFSYYAQETRMSLNDTRAEIISMGYPQSIVDNAQALIEDGAMNDAFWAETLLKMTLEERNRMNQVWKEHRPTSAFVYLGVIPAQNISFISFNNEDPPREIGNYAFDDYEDEFAANYRFQPMFSKITMALRPEDLQNWINTNGPYAYHDTYNENINNILKNGIVPLTELPNAGQIEEQYYDIYHLLPRPGFVYLHTNAGDGNYHGLDKNGSRVVVDLRKLDPKRFSADEDYVESEFLKNPHDELFEDIFSYPTTHPNWTTEEIDKWNDTEPQTLGEWASENAHVVDDPDVSLKSLQEYKTIAYQGIIPPEAIVRVDAL